MFILSVVVLCSNVLSRVLGETCWSCHSDSDLSDYSGAPFIGSLYCWIDYTFRILIFVLTSSLLLEVVKLSSPLFIVS